MHKKLQVLGNSLALVIDKPTRRLLNIGRNTKLRVTTDGRRLVVEPITEQPPAPTASELDAPAVFATLLGRFGMSQGQFDRLHHKPQRMLAYAGQLKLGSEASDTDRATIRRFEACLRALRQGASWNEAIIVALHTEPKPGEPPSAPPEALHEDPHDDALPIDRVDERTYVEEDDDENPVDGVFVPLGSG